jgi:aryl-alcohol dehydrogenase-like predicted oxidoreductase
MPPKTYLFFGDYDGDLRIMPAFLPRLGAAGVKVVNSHPGNQRYGLPSVLATLLLIDPKNGLPTAIIGANSLTSIRTGAAGGLAAKCLARPDSRVVGMIGAGVQARTQLQAVLEVLPGIERVKVYDLSEKRAAEFTKEFPVGSGRRIEVVESPERAARASDVLVTTTPSRSPIVKRAWLDPGTHINAIGADAPPEIPKERILNYNEKMEYRRWGKANHMISAVCLGGHWKRINKMVSGFQGDGWMGDVDNPDFQKNRTEVVGRCIEVGINYVDACARCEVLAYSRALKGRRDKMHLGYSWSEKEMRNDNYRTAKALLQSLDEGMKEAGLDYVDLWRITMNEQSGQHAKGDVEEMMKALEAAKKQGKARCTGFSSHDQPHIKWMIETFPAAVDVVVTPYTARSKELPTGSLFDAVRKLNVGVFGIKPFASNSIFKGDSSPTSPTAEEDDRLARMAIRYILANPAITAPIPGLISTHQVDNVAAAVAERRKLDLAEQQELRKAMDEAWARLPQDYEWLKEWDHV